MQTITKKGSGSYQKPEAFKQQEYYNINPDEKDPILPEPEEHPEDLSKRKTPCEELNFHRIENNIYNHFYHYLHEREAA